MSLYTDHDGRLLPLLNKKRAKFPDRLLISDTVSKLFTQGEKNTLQLVLFPSKSDEQIHTAKTDNSLDDAGWNVDILHWDDFSELLQTIHILDLTAELGAVENRKQKLK